MERVSVEEPAMPSLDELHRDFLLPDAAGEVFRVDGADEPRDLPCVIAIGAFDGCHRGHQELLAHAAEDARARGVSSVAVTFDPDPDQVLPGEPAPKLMSFDDRIRALAGTVDKVAIVPFTLELAALDHEAFFTQVLAPALDIRAVHVGMDFRLGRGGSSTVEVIRAWAHARGIEVHGHELIRDHASPITATRIRKLLERGSIEAVTRELGRRHLVRGVVQRGRGQGTGMGFPTANIGLAQGLQLSADGVYAGLALVDGQVWPAAINAGLPPMFDTERASAHLEANLIGYKGDLYGKDIAVIFERRLRPSRKFASIDALIETVNNDIQTVRELFGDESVQIA